MCRVQADLEAIRSALLQRRGALINMTGDERTLEVARPHVAAFLDALPAKAAGPSDWTNRLPRRNEAITVPTQACSFHFHVINGPLMRVQIFAFEAILKQAGSQHASHATVTHEVKTVLSFLYPGQAA